MNAKPHTFYKTYGSGVPQEVRVERFTKASVWLVGIPGRCYSRISNYECYWPTLDAAIRHLRDAANRRISGAEKRIKNLTEDTVRAKKAVESYTAQLESGEGIYSPYHEPHTGEILV